MWSTQCALLENGRAQRFEILKKSSRASYADVLKWWRDDAEFRSFFTQLLADAPYAAFRWETPPITRATAERPFEFVVLDSPGLARTPDQEAFAAYFPPAEPDDAFVSFPNLGNDAVLVVPCPVGPQAAYGHLAAFVREAPEPQRTSLWRVVGQQMEQRLGTAPIWLSTAGARRLVAAHAHRQSAQVLWFHAIPDGPSCLKTRCGWWRAVMGSSTADIREAFAIHVAVSADTLSVELADGRTISAPLTWYPRLTYATTAERRSWRLIGGGMGIHWPQLDEDVSVANLLAGQPSAESQSSLKRWLAVRGKRSRAKKQSGA